MLEKELAQLSALKRVGTGAAIGGAGGALSMYGMEKAAMSTPEMKMMQRARNSQEYSPIDNPGDLWIGDDPRKRVHEYIYGRKYPNPFLPERSISSFADEY